MRIMFFLPLVLGLTACATHSERPAGCSGPARPANPHGSVLVTSPKPAEPPKAVGPKTPGTPASAAAKPLAINDRSGRGVGRCSA